MEQKIQQKVQLFLPIILRTIGPILLRSGLGGAGGVGGTTTTNDDDEDGEDDGVVSGDSKTRKTGGGGKVSISLPTFPPDEDDDDEDEDEDEADTSSASSTTTTKATPILTQAANTRTTREVIDTTTATLAQLEESTPFDVTGRLDIRIRDETLVKSPADSIVPPEEPSSTTTASATNDSTLSDVILEVFASSPVDEQDTTTSSLDQLPANNVASSVPQGLIHSSSNNPKPSGLYLPVSSDDSNLVRRRKATRN